MPTQLLTKQNILDNPVYELAYTLAEIANETPPPDRGIDWVRYVGTATVLLGMYDIKRKPTGETK